MGTKKITVTTTANHKVGDVVRFFYKGWKFWQVVEIVEESRNAVSGGKYRMKPVKAPRGAC